MTDLTTIGEVLIDLTQTGTRLLLLARQGDPAAREQLVSGNLRLFCKRPDCLSHRS